MGLLFTYVMTYGGCALGLFRPYYALLIYMSFGLIYPPALWHWSVPPGNYSRIIAIGMLLGWAGSGFGTWSAGRGRGTILALILFWAVLLLGSLHAPDQDLAWQRFDTVSKIILPWLVAVTLIDSVRKLRQIAWVLVISQGYLAFEFNLSYLKHGINTLDFFFAGLDNNGIAITMVTGTGMAFFLGLHARFLWMKALAFALAGCMIHVVLFTTSRGGIVALIVTGAVSFVLIPKRLGHYLYFALLVAGTIYFMGPEVRKRFSTTFADEEHRDGSAETRVRNWKACWQSMQDTPLGVGTANWPVIAPSYGLPRMAAHSTWMQVGAELGFPGLLCLLGFYLYTAMKLWPLARGRVPMSDPWIQYLARMAIAAIAGFVVSAQFVSLEGAEIPYYAVLIGVGALKLHSMANNPGPSSESSDPRTESPPNPSAHADPSANGIATSEFKLGSRIG
jgi:O-antigen ligase